MVKVQYYFKTRLNRRVCQGAQNSYIRQEPSPYTTTRHVLHSVYARDVLDFGNPFESHASWGDDADSSDAVICVTALAGDIPFYVPRGGGCGGVKSGIDDGRYRSPSTKTEQRGHKGCHPRVCDLKVHPLTRRDPVGRVGRAQNLSKRPTLDCLSAASRRPSRHLQ